MHGGDKKKPYELSSRLGQWGYRRMPLLEFLPSLIATVNLTANCDKNKDVLFNPAEAVLPVKPPM
jgi:hypothetical protein